MLICDHVGVLQNFDEQQLRTCRNLPSALSTSPVARSAMVARLHLALLLCSHAVVGAQPADASATSARRRQIQELLKSGSYVKAKNALKAELQTLTGTAHQAERAEVLSELGEVYIQWGKHTEAIGAYEEATELIEAVHGRRDPRFGVAADKLADAHGHLGNHAEAVPLYQELVENMLRGPMGSGHPGLRLTLGKLGSSALEGKNVGAATKAYGQLLELSEGDDSSGALTARANANLQLARVLALPSKRDAPHSKVEKARLQKALKVRQQSAAWWVEG